MILWNIAGLSALAAIPAIVLIHLFRRRFTPRPVSGLFLYGPPVKTIASGRTRQRILWYASLWAELFAVVCAAWYLCDPHLRSHMDARVMTVVLDNRWRMQAGTPGQTVADRVRSEIDQRLAELSVHDRATIIISGQPPRILCGPAARSEEARHLLSTWNPTDAWHELTPAIAFAQSLSGTPTQTIVVSDRVPDDKISNVDYLAFGQSASNSGIADVRWWRDGNGQRIMTRIYAHGNPAPRSLQLRQGDIVLAQQTVATPSANGDSTIIFPLAQDFAASSLTVALTGSDPLPYDDVVHVAQPTFPVLHIALRCDPALSSPLKKLLSLFSDTIIDAPSTTPHLIITDTAMTTATGTWVLRLQSLSDKAALGPFLMHRGHPVISGLDFTGVLWHGGAINQTENALPLIRAGDVTLFSEERIGRDRHWTCALDIKKSTVLSHPAWPSLLANVLATRRAALPGALTNTVLTTQITRVVLPVGSNTLSVVDASSKNASFTSDHDGVVLIPPCTVIGPLILSLDGTTPWLTLQVIPCDSRMGDLTQATQAIVTSPTQSQAAVERVRSPLDHFLPLIFFLLAAGSAWFFFTREEGRAP
jgi:hypothetical protein